MAVRRVVRGRQPGQPHGGGGDAGVSGPSDHCLLGEKRVVRDWSLITGWMGGYKMGKSRVRNCVCPPHDRVTLFAPPPPFRDWKLIVNMAETSSYRVKTTPKRFVSSSPPSAWLKLFSPTLFVGVKLHMPPTPVV